MTIQQHLAMTTCSHALATPTTWQARRDYRRAQRFARSLELAECQASFIDPHPKSATWYRWGLYYPLSCLAFLALLAMSRAVVPSAISDWLSIALACLLVLLLPFSLIALSVTLFRRTLFHCEQIHLYTNGIVAIDPRGHCQGARYQQLFDFRRGAHESPERFSRIHWDMIRAAVAHPQRGQAPTLKITPHLPDGVEICALIERGYTQAWLPRFREQLAAGDVLDFDALLLHQDWLGKTTPGVRRFSASVPSVPALSPSERAVAPGMARGVVLQQDAATPVEWLRREEIKSLRADDRFILIRTVEPVRRDKQGRADRLWFQVDTLELKDAAILKEMVPEYRSRLAHPRVSLIQRKDKLIDFSS